MSLGRRAQAQRIGTSNREQCAVEPPYPWDDPAIVESNHQFRAHPHRTTNPFDDPDDVRCAPSRRHEVDDAHGPVGRLMKSFKDQRVRAIAPAGLGVGFDRSHQPPTVFGAPEQRREAGA